jgi:hypothetical protein
VANHEAPARRTTRRARAALLGTWLVTVGALVAAFGGAAAATAASAHHSASAAQVRTLHTKGAKRASSGGPLVDHGGKILPSSNTYAIWWGTASAWASDVEPGIGTFFSGLNGTSFLNTGTQYMRGASIGSSFKGSVSDPSAPPKKVSASTLGQEVAKMYGSSLDPNGIYFVYTSNFPKGGGFCAWHSFTNVNGQSIAVAYMPNTTNVSGCDPGNLYGLSGSEGLRSLANVTSHEFMEAITDTLPANGSYGWIDSSGSEIGDKCAWTFNGAVTLSNGSKWQLQQEWSNAAGGCVQTT